MNRRPNSPSLAGAAVLFFEREPCWPFSVHRTQASSRTFVRRSRSWHPRSRGWRSTGSRRCALSSGSSGRSTRSPTRTAGRSSWRTSRAGFFDSDDGAGTVRLDGRRTRTTETILRKVAREQPNTVEEVLPEFVPAPLPWPTYGQATVEQIPEFAAMLNLVPEAIRYEKENLQRVAVLAPLMDALDPERAKDAEPQYEVPAESLQPMVKGRGGQRVGKPVPTNAKGIVTTTPGLVVNPTEEDRVSAATITPLEYGVSDAPATFIYAKADLDTTRRAEWPSEVTGSLKAPLVGDEIDRAPLAPNTDTQPAVADRRDTGERACPDHRQREVVEGVHGDHTEDHEDHDGVPVPRGRGVVHPPLLGAGDVGAGDERERCPDDR